MTEAEDIPVAVEDRFVVIDGAGPERRFASPRVISNMSEAVTQLTGTWQFLWDLREPEALREEVLAAYQAATDSWPDAATRILASPDTRPAILDTLDQLPASQLITMRARSLPGVDLPLDDFRDPDVMTDGAMAILEGRLRRDYLDIWGIEPLDPHVEVHAFEAYLEDTRFHSALPEYQTAALDSFLRRIGENSLLTQIAIHVERDRVHVLPYHSHSLHQVPTVGDDLVLVRPGRASQRGWQTFEAAISRLERLLNDPRTAERDIERLLQENPLFLRGLNFQAVYPQVVLPQAGRRGLRPDIIAEPMDSEWASIIDLKLPSVPVLVGREGRARLAHGIHSVVRQLREYGAYFDDRRLAKQVEDRYGFKCYQPRLVAIVGREPAGFGAEEIRRAMTTYPDVEIVTYDQLLQAARRLLLL